MSVATPPRPTQQQSTARLGFSLAQALTQPGPEPSAPVLPAAPKTGQWIAVALPVSAFGAFAVYGPAAEFGDGFSRVFWLIVASAVLAYCLVRAGQGLLTERRPVLAAALLVAAGATFVIGGAPALAAFVPVTLGVLVVGAAQIGPQRVRRERARLTAAHELAVTAWRDGLAATARFAAVDVTRPRVDVVGGTPTGWAALLTTFAAGELDCGRRVQVLDLTATGAAARLAVAAAERGFAVTTCVLPEQLAELEFAADLDADDVRDVVENVLRDDSAPDDGLVHAVLDVLGDRATLARLAAGLQVVLGHHGSGLSSDEVAALHGVSAGPEVRRRALALYNELTAIADAGTRAAGEDDADLGVFALDGRGNDYDSAILRSFLVHATLRTHRGGTLVVCGAERLPVHTLERLLQAAAAQDLGLLLLYADLTEEIAPLLGRDDAPVAFMRMGTAQTARRAAARIGGRRFVLSRVTDIVSESIADRVGEAYQRSATRREAASAGGAWAALAGWEAPDAAGTREFLVEPDALQALPRTAAIVLHDGASFLIDVNPALTPAD